MNKGIYLKQIMSAFFWGGMYVAAKVVTEGIPPVSTSFFRFFIAGILLLALWGASRQTLPKGREWLVIFLLAVTGAFLYNILFFAGMKTVSAGRGAVIITTNPVFTAILSRVIFKERLSPLRVLGIALASAGAMWVITRGNPLTLFSSSFSSGDALLLVAALLWSVYSLLNKASSMPPLTTITFTCLIGCILLAPFALHENIIFSVAHESWQVLLALLYIGICGTVLPFVWFNHGVMVLGAQRASLFINLIPVFALFFGALFLKEAVPFWLLGGVLLICFGIFLANRRA